MSSADQPGATPARSVRDAIEFCMRRANLRRTLRIAAVVGVVLTLINQSGALFGGHPGTLTWVRCGLNFVVPFVVSNAGLLAARSEQP